jgi:hypothetical protein
MIKIIHARWIKDQQMTMAFSDGSEGVYKFAYLLAVNTPLTQPLKEASKFQKFFLGWLRCAGRMVWNLAHTNFTPIC